MRLEPVDYRAGDVVIKQGEAGDYFYVVVKGRCSVIRESPLNPQGVKLAELKMGNTFGEESLIADSKRNATVTMLSDGCLMRLSKEDFRQLLHEPLLDWLDAVQAQSVLAAGGQWIDVRLPSEFEHYRAQGSINIPLHSLRLRIGTLERERHYVVCCDTGRRSSVGAYLLAQRGFRASVLRGGLSGSGASVVSSVGANAGEGAPDSGAGALASR